MPTVININLSGSQVRSLSPNTQERVLPEIGILPGFTNAHPFVDRKIAPKKKKQCSKGHQCGFSCVSANKVCLADMTTAQLKAHNAAKRAERKSAKGGGGAGNRVEAMRNALMSKDFDTLTQLADQVYVESRNLAQSKNGDFYLGIQQGNGTENDWILSTLYKKTGFDGLPEKITAKELNAYAKSGETVMYRAMSTSQASFQRRFDAFKNGDYHAGHGIYGHGTYVAWADGQSMISRTLEDEFLRKMASGDTKGYGVKMMKMTLKDGSNIANMSELSVKMQMDQSDFRSWEKSKIASISDPVQLREFKQTVRRTKAVLWGDADDYGDVHSGRYAVVRGIDAVKLDDSYSPNTYMLLLNRSAVRVSNVAVKPGSV